MDVTLDISDGLARIRLDDGKKNAITAGALDDLGDLADALDEVEAIDNDGDGTRDAVGTSPDPECSGMPWHDSEAVPEPSTVSMLLAGVGWLRWLARRRQRALPRS